jgi:hypothetical protein
MSVALAINVHDGIILAADSASTLILGAVPAAGAAGGQVANVYNNANKIANLHKGEPIGCVTFGSGSIGSASISTLLKDFRKRITEDGAYFDPKNYALEGIANSLAEFLMAECQKLSSREPQPTLGIFLGGYSSGAALGERWGIQIQNGTCKLPTRLHEPHVVGINWGGEGGEAISRLFLGYSQGLPQTLADIIKDPKQAEEIVKGLGPRLQANLIFAPMPIQDAIDLAEFLVHTAVQFSRFSPGPQVVGGPIEIAAITKHEGFKWIRRKHYYGVKLNRETHDD